MEESSLRLLLLIVGGLILFGIYFYDKIKNRPNQADDFIDEALKVQPVIVDDEAPLEEPVVATPDVNIAEEQVAHNVEAFSVQKADPVVNRSAEDPIPVVEEAPVVQLLVMPNESSPIEGVALLNVFTELNLEFGDMGIFHRYCRQDGVETQLFHVANIMEPGTFPVGSMNEFETRGLVVFFQANQSLDVMASFDDMLEAARSVCQHFDCSLMTTDMQELTFEKIDDIRHMLATYSAK